MLKIICGIVLAIWGMYFCSYSTFMFLQNKGKKNQVAIATSIIIFIFSLISVAIASLLFIGII